jgi:hypothetical protein
LKGERAGIPARVQAVLERQSQEANDARYASYIASRWNDRPRSHRSVERFAEKYRNNAEQRARKFQYATAVARMAGDEKYRADVYQHAEHGGAGSVRAANYGIGAEAGAQQLVADYEEFLETGVDPTPAGNRHSWRAEWW